MNATVAHTSKAACFGALQPAMNFDEILPAGNGAVGQGGVEIAGFMRAQDDGLSRLINGICGNSTGATYVPGSALTFTPPIQGQNVRTRERLSRLREELHPRIIAGGGSPRYAGYVASGYDVSSVASVFPDASAYILINNGPVIDVQPPFDELSPRIFTVPALDFDETLIRLQHGATNVVRTRRVSALAQEHGGILNLILANLKVAYPELALIGLMIFFGAQTYPPRPDEEMPTEAIASAVYYRTAAADIVRAVVYINADVRPYESGITIDYPKAPMQCRQVPVDLSFLDGLLIKGSNGAFSPLMYDPQTYRPPDCEIIREHLSRDKLLRHVARNGGVVVEGRHSHPYDIDFMHPVWAWECFPDELCSCPDQDPLRTWTIIHQSETMLSYAGGTRVWRAIPPSRRGIIDR